MIQTTEVQPLLIRVKAGDAVARGQLLGSFERYLTLLTRVQIGPRLQGKVDLADVVQERSPDYCEVIVLRHLEGLGFSEVASRMGRSEDSVQKLWVRALGKLREALGKTQ